MKEKLKRINLIIKLMCLALILSISCYTRVFANELKQNTPLIDVEKKAILKITYDNNENMPLTGVNFKIYRVASVSNAFYYTLIDEFKDYSVNCNGLKTAEQWSDLATTLDGYVSKDRIMPLIEKNTDENGQIQINNLKTGLYLLVGDKKEIGITTYSCKPALISLPNLSAENIWDYEVEVEPKVDKFDDVNRLYDKKVTTVWDDSRYEYARPESTILRLYRKISSDEQTNEEYELYEEVILNEGNNWSYTFKNLDRKYEYKLVEMPVEGYSISISEEGNLYTITNTYIAKTVDNEILPKTGQPWLIVQVLAILGILFFAIGYILNKKRKREYEK